MIFWKRDKLKRKLLEDLDVKLLLIPYTGHQKKMKKYILYKLIETEYIFLLSQISN